MRNARASVSARASRLRDERRGQLTDAGLERVDLVFRLDDGIHALAATLRRRSVGSGPAKRGRSGSPRQTHLDALGAGAASVRRAGASLWGRRSCLRLVQLKAPERHEASASRRRTSLRVLHVCSAARARRSVSQPVVGGKEDVCSMCDRHSRSSRRRPCPACAAACSDRLSSFDGLPVWMRRRPTCSARGFGKGQRERVGEEGVVVARLDDGTQGSRLG